MSMGRAARTANEIIKPEIGIALGIGIVYDAPKVGAEEAQEKFGNGPVIFLYTASVLPNRKIPSRIAPDQWFISLRRRSELPMLLRSSGQHGRPSA